MTTKHTPTRKILILGDQAAPEGAAVDRELGRNETYSQAFLIDQLQLMRRGMVVDYLREVWKRLADGAPVIVTVPSLEWAAQEIMTKDEPGMAAFWTIYGGGERQYLCGFTLLWLRAALQEAGFTVIQAERRHVLLNEHPAMENYVVAIKRGAGEAIS